MKKIAIIGSGATSIYLLKHLLDNIDILKNEIKSISIFEKNAVLGMGMPYNPETTDLYNLSNISSEELPQLEITFENWLKKQNLATLEKLGINKDEIDKSEVYNRLSLGQYLVSQYQAITEKILESGIIIKEYANTEIKDISYNPRKKEVTLIAALRGTLKFEKVIIATGHMWNEEDQIESGYYSSPWPISKILPKPLSFNNYTVGTLGASLSAFDVVSSLSRRNGKFEEDTNGNLKFKSYKGAEKFKIVMHSTNGWLPHLQYEQEEPIRQIYRHFDRDSLYKLLDEEGYLRIETYFTKLCSKALHKAFIKDKMKIMAERVLSKNYSFSDFIEDMTEKHEYSNAFEGMRKEMIEAKKSVENKKPIHWKEVIDDLMYALNFHVALMPAEDHIYFHKEIMPFLMNVIAAMPIPSGKILLALYDAGKIEIIKGKVTLLDSFDDKFTSIKVSEGNTKSIHEYKMFINCSGQSPITVENYPFQSLVMRGFVNSPLVRFKNRIRVSKFVNPRKKKLVLKKKNNFYYKLPGIAIDSAYCILTKKRNPIESIHDISFTHTLGLRPYSYGLQACNATSEILVSSWVEAIKNSVQINGTLTSVTKIYEMDSQL